MRVVAVSDDPYAPPRSVEAFLAFYPNASRKLERVDAAAFGGDRIGHFGFFRERFSDSLWKDAADRLAAR
jgi:predicted alpha/beta hydrolase